MASTTEHERLQEAREINVPWRKWGPYLSERQWGTVREDYSDNGDAWNYFTHDQARSRAYRWGEDGLAGICDDHQVLCFALALWNGKDPILKERMFGLTNSEANHGEDVKEYYFYLDSTPTHSYMKYLYKYSQAAYPYSNLVETNRRRSRSEFEYELLDTGVFDGDRYFDVVVKYAKAAPEDLLIRISVHNRGPEAALLHLLPTLWFRNTWSWPDGGSKPILQAVESTGYSVIHAGLTDPLFQESLADYDLYCEGTVPLLFTENETNNVRLFGTPNSSPYVKDGVNNAIVVEYLPAESDSGMFGGNSNWRGPVWFPVNAMIIRALLQFYFYYGDNFQVECPTGSGRLMNLFEVAKEIADRLTRIFLRDERGRRPVYGGTEKFQSDPHWRDHLLFYEYFHGDNGAGLGASHQTGWTGLVGTLIRLFGALDAEHMLEVGKIAAFGQSPAKA